jgi:Ca2+-binding EF-hand superfamily protein
LKKNFEKDKLNNIDEEYNKIDIDKNGTVDKEEFMTYLKKEFIGVEKKLKSELKDYEKKKEKNCIIS